MKYNRVAILLFHADEKIGFTAERVKNDCAHRQITTGTFRC